MEVLAPIIVSLALLAAPLAAQARQCSVTGTSTGNDMTSVEVDTGRGDMSNFNILVEGVPVSATVSQSGTKYTISLSGGGEIDNGEEMTIEFDVTGNWGSEPEGWQWCWHQG